MLSNIKYMIDNSTIITVKTFSVYQHAFVWLWFYWDIGHKKKFEHKKKFALKVLYKLLGVIF